MKGVISLIILIKPALLLSAVEITQIDFQKQQLQFSGNTAGFEVNGRPVTGNQYSGINLQRDRGSIMLTHAGRPVGYLCWGVENSHELNRAREAGIWSGPCIARYDSYYPVSLNLYGAFSGRKKKSAEAYYYRSALLKADTAAIQKYRRYYTVENINTVDLNDALIFNTEGLIAGCGRIQHLPAGVYIIVFKSGSKALFRNFRRGER